MKWLDAIPRIWKRAYLLICLWYAINFTISAVLEWKFVKPEYYVLWTALFLLEAFGRHFSCWKRYVFVSCLFLSGAIGYSGFRLCGKLLGTYRV